VTAAPDCKQPDTLGHLRGRAVPNVVDWSRPAFEGLLGITPEPHHSGWRE
jgi:hypothetical protein